MIEIDKIYNEDCLIGMQKIDDKSIDCIICDLPYGTTSLKWDSIIPFDKLWEQYNRICKGNIVLFSSGLFTYKLIESNLNKFKYKLIWKKNVPTGMGSAKYRPMKYYEEICIFNGGTYNPIMKERIGVGKACYNYDHYCGESITIPILESNLNDMILILFNHLMFLNLMLSQIEMEKYTQHKNQSI